jgi:hypothetical protein
MAFCMSVSGSQRLLPDIHELALESIDFMCREKFRPAEEEAKKIIKKYPNNPAGYFFCAAVVESWMSYYESNRREEEFYRYCDLAVEKAENILNRNPDDEWALFFQGGAEGCKGTYESRYEKWITSIRHGWKGFSCLQTLHRKKPDFKDVSYGLGTYDYWRTTLTRLLWWMPGVPNRTEQGIRELKEAKNEGIYTRNAASTSLIFVLNNEHRFRESLIIAEEMLARYPGALVFCQGKAAALFGLGRYGEAESVYRFILSRVESEQYDNHYNAVICHFWLAKIYLKMKWYTQSIAECNRMEYYKITNDIRNRLGKYFSDAGKIKSESRAASIGKTGAEMAP